LVRSRSGLAGNKRLFVEEVDTTGAFWMRIISLQYSWKGVVSLTVAISF
jgi:hypothetical protein